MQLFNKIKCILFPLILITVTAVIAYRNYLPGTFLSGWDNLHPEFNFSLNVGRSLNAVWQSYQGLGVLGGMTHAADLPRQLILWGLSFILPLNFLRYFWIFAMLALGPVGVYFLLLLLTGGKKIAAFSGSLFYLFNLATVQYFYTPYEAFIGFYGFFPWLLFLALDYFKAGGKKKLFYFALVSLLATPAFYVQTMFIVYLIFLLALAVTRIKRGLVIVITIITINAFWLFPAAYFTLTSSSIPAGSHINSISTPETQLMNQAQGRWQDIFQLKGFWFNYYDLFANGKSDYLYRDWLPWVGNQKVILVAQGLFVLSLLGVVINLFKKKSPFTYSIAFLFLFSYLMLAGNNPPFGAIYAFIAAKVPLFADIFRSAFTKWSVALALIVATGISLLLAKLRGVALYILIPLIVASSIYVVLPVFQGKLISDKMKVNIPTEYFEVFNWFNKNSDGGRVAFLPFHNFWGWTYNSWGYDGSGFIWYGVKNPVLDTNFDVWSPYNQDFYNQASFALYNQGPEYFVKVLQQYKVKYLLMDESVINPNANMYKSSFDSPNIREVAKFNFLTVYEVSPGLTLTRTVLVSPIRNNQSVITEKFVAGQGFAQAKNCDLKQLGTVVKERRPEGNFYGAYDGAVACDYFYYPDIKYDQGYLLHIQGENITGRSLKIYLQNYITGRMDVEELLPTGKFDSYYPIQPKLATSDMGMNLNVETRAFGRIASENLITKIEFIPVDFIQASEVPDNRNIITNNQAYEAGWMAIANFRTLPHVKVNGWENGWIGTSAFIFFWPQLLEWGGMAIGIGTLLILVLTKGKPKL